MHSAQQLTQEGYTDSFTLSQRQKMSLTQVYVHVLRAHIGLIDMVIISLSQ